MNLVSLSVLGNHQQATKMLASIGILNFGDFALFRAFYSTPEEEFREAKKIGIIKEHYQKLLQEIDIYTQKAQQFTLFDEISLAIKYAPLTIDKKNLVSDSLSEQLNTIICSRSLSLISGWKGSGKTHFGFVNQHQHRIEQNNDREFGKAIANHRLLRVPQHQAHR